MDVSSIVVAIRIRFRSTIVTHGTRCDGSFGPMRPMIIDTHTHLFASDRNRFPLASDPMYTPDTDGSAELLRSQMDEASVDRAVTISPWPYKWDMSYALDVLES